MQSDPLTPYIGIILIISSIIFLIIGIYNYKKIVKNIKNSYSNNKK